MVLRVLQFLIGAVFAGGGGYLVWTHRADAANLFPPGAAGLPVLLVAGLLGVTSGIVFLVSAVHPRPNQRRLAAEKAARDDAALGQAEAYYSERARAADRDWRSADITPPPAPPKAPEPVTPPITAAPPPEMPPAVMPPPQPPRGQRTLSMPPAAPPAAPQPAPPAPPEPPRQAAAPPPKPAVKPVASAAAAPAPPSPFPARVTLNPIPRASDPPPAAAQPVAPKAPPPPVSSDDPHAHIRAAIHAGKLEEADGMLAAARDNATGMDLALLTALAGDHAAVSGRQSHAKWLWRLALKRFGELDAMNSPAAKGVAESLRQAG